MGVERDTLTAYCWSSSGDDVNLLYLIISSITACCDWYISILAVVVTVKLDVLSHATLLTSATMLVF